MVSESIDNLKMIDTYAEDISFDLFFNSMYKRSIEKWFDGNNNIFINERRKFKRL